MKRRKWLQRQMTRNKNLSNGSDIDFYEVKAKQKQGVFRSCHTKLFIRCGGVALLDDQRHTGKVVQRGGSYRMYSPRDLLWRTSNSGEDVQLESMEPVSKEMKGAKSVSPEFTVYWKQPKCRWVFEYIISNTTNSRRKAFMIWKQFHLFSTEKKNCKLIHCDEGHFFPKWLWQISFCGPGTGMKYKNRGNGTQKSIRNISTWKTGIPF